MAAGDPVRAAGAARDLRLLPAAAQHPAQLPARGPDAVPARGHGAGAAPVPRGERHRRAAVRPRHPLGDLRAREERRRQEAVRHRARRVRRRLQLAEPLDRAAPDGGRPRGRPAGHRRRRAVHAAVLRVGAQHLGDELRRAGRGRGAGDEPGREGGRLRPRHRRGRAVALPQGGRGRPDLADRHRLLRLPRRERRLRPRGVPHERDPAAGQDDRDQGLAGRQARPRRHPPGGEGDRGDRRGPARARRARTCSRRRTTRRSRRRWR